jgi:formate dehydrogenase major subunit
VAARRGEAPRAGQARRRDRGRHIPPRSRPGPRLEGAEDEIINKAFWTYTTAEDVLREINGYALRDNPETGLKAGDLVRKVSDLRSDGSTSSGAWIYAGVFANGENLSKRRDSRTDPGGLGLYPGFGWTWPNNMRILYNRASCDRNGKPYPGSKPIVWWDEQAKRWTGYDVPDVPVLTDGPDTPNGKRPFHLGAEGVGRLFAAVYSDPDEKHPGYPRDVAYVPKDGPLPEMYEPVESPVENLLHPKVKSNPMLKYPRVATHQPIGTADKFPYVLMTSTVAEHWCAGSTTRNIPWLNELVPEPSWSCRSTSGRSSASNRGTGSPSRSARGELTVQGPRDAPDEALKIGDREVTIRLDAIQLGLPGLSTGPSVNHLTIDAADPGAGTQETKACLVNVVRADRPKAARSPVTEGTRMTQHAAGGPDPGDADRHRQLHRSAARARWPASSGTSATARRPSWSDHWASRTRPRSARRRTRSSRSTRWRTRRSREAWNPPS